MKNLLYGIIPFIILALIGITVGMGIEIVIYLAPFIRILFLIVFILVLASFSLCLFKGLRKYVGHIILVFAISCGILTWTEGFTTTYPLGGKSAVVISMLFLGVGPIPAGIIISAIKGQWLHTASILFLLCVSYALVLWSNRLLLQQEQVPANIPPVNFGSHDRHESYDEIDDMETAQQVASKRALDHLTLE